MILGHQVFVHGGLLDRRDFLVLNLLTMEWTLMADFGFPKDGIYDGISDHAMAPGSNSEIIVLGGTDGVGNTYPCRPFSEVKVFDVKKGKWRDEEPLPAEILGGKTTLTNHHLIEISREGGAWIVCLGGRNDDSHPNHLLLLDISY